MTIKPLKLLVFVALIAALVAYTFYYNPQPLAVKYASNEDSVIIAPAAVILMTIFFTGFLISSLFATYFGLQNSFKYWRKDSTYKSKDLHLNNLILARQEISLKNSSAARNILERILEKDPKDTIAGLMLVESYRKEKDFKSALKVMEDFRAVDHKNLEILMLTAELYEEQGNDSAAYDNYKLLFEVIPNNKLVLNRLISLCLKIDKTYEALELSKRLVKTADNYEEQQSFLNKQATIELEVILNKFKNAPQEQKKQIEQLTKNHKNFAPAYFQLAIIEKNNFQLDQAGKLFSLAYAEENKLPYLEELTKMWLGAEQPDKAITYLKACIHKQTKTDTAADSSLIDSKIFLAELLSHLEDNTSSKKELLEIQKLTNLSLEQKQKVKLLLAIIENKNGNTQDALKEISELSKSYIKLNSFSYLKIESQNLNKNADEFREWSKRAKEVLKINQSPTV